MSCRRAHARTPCWSGPREPRQPYSRLSYAHKTQAVRGDDMLLGGCSGAAWGDACCHGGCCLTLASSCTENRKKCSQHDRSMKHAPRAAALPLPTAWRWLRCAVNSRKSARLASARAWAFAHRVDVVSGGVRVTARACLGCVMGVLWSGYGVVKMSLLCRY